LEEAKKRLIKAGETPGSPPLNSFGPNMKLAKELLLVGEKETVLQYLEDCSKFWESGKDLLDKWTADINEGRTPEFEPNLTY